MLQSWQMGSLDPDFVQPHGSVLVALFVRTLTPNSSLLAMVRMMHWLTHLL